MTTKIEIKGMSFFGTDSGKNKFTRLALADVNLPDLGMSISGLCLTWSKERGFVALAPSALIYGGRPAVRWGHHGAFGRALAAKLAAMYAAMGGTLPEPAAEPTPANDDEPNEGEEFREGLAAVLKEALQ